MSKILALLFVSAFFASCETCYTCYDPVRHFEQEICAGNGKISANVEEAEAAGWVCEERLE